MDGARSGLGDELGSGVVGSSFASVLMATGVISSELGAENMCRNGENC